MAYFFSCHAGTDDQALRTDLGLNRPGILTLRFALGLRN